MTDNILRPEFGQKAKTLPFEIRFGESQAAIVCSNCKKLQKAGFFVVYGQLAVLVCVSCTANAIVKYQDTHLFAEKTVEIDAEVSPEVLNRVVQEVVREHPDLPGAKVEKIVRSAVEKL